MIFVLHGLAHAEAMPVSSQGVPGLSFDLTSSELGGSPDLRELVVIARERLCSLCKRPFGEVDPRRLFCAACEGTP